MVALQFLRKLGIDLPQKLTIPLLGIYPKEPLTYHKETCSTTFIAVLSIISRNWRKSRCPSTKEWKRKMWYNYTMNYYSANKYMASS